MFTSFDSDGLSTNLKGHGQMGIDYSPGGRINERTLLGIDAQVMYMEAQQAQIARASQSSQPDVTGSSC